MLTKALFSGNFFRLLPKAPPSSFSVVYMWVNWGPHFWPPFSCIVSILFSNFSKLFMTFTPTFFPCTCIQYIYRGLESCCQPFQASSQFWSVTSFNFFLTFPPTFFPLHMYTCIGILNLAGLYKPCPNSGQSQVSPFFWLFPQLFFFPCTCMHVSGRRALQAASQLWSFTSLNFFLTFLPTFLASQDALEVMRVTHSLTYLLTGRSHWLYWCDPGEWWTYRRLYWCDPELMTLIKVTWWWELSSDDSFLVMKVF